MDIELSCPLGHQCETAENNKINRCAWYKKLVGKDPQSLKEYDEWGCAMSWLPILLVENSQRQISTSAAVESFRNEMVEGNNKFLGIINQAKAISDAGSTD